MSISVPDYRKIYKLQDKIISQIIHLLGNFYLTGGTALGRFYLNHRFSDDLDFFLNNDNEFGKKAREIFLFMKKHFMIDDSKSLMAEDYIRFVVVDKVTMKVEFVNDIAHRCGETCITQNKIPVDNICNILTNKITAILGRDEAKDIYDVIKISENFHFNWKTIYKQVYEKYLTNEADIAWRLNTFPPEWLEGKPWLKEPVIVEQIREKLKIISDDFLFARDNSLGIGKIHIMEAMPIANNK